MLFLKEAGGGGVAEIPDAIEKFQQLWPLGDTSVVCVTVHPGVPQCVTTVEPGTLRTNVLIREVPLYHYLIVATVQRLQQCR